MNAVRLYELSNYFATHLEVIGGREVVPFCEVGDLGGNRTYFVFSGAKV